MRLLQDYATTRVLMVAPRHEQCPGESPKQDCQVVSRMRLQGAAPAFRSHSKQQPKAWLRCEQPLVLRVNHFSRRPKAPRQCIFPTSLISPQMKKNEKLHPNKSYMTKQHQRRGLAPWPFEQAASSSRSHPAKPCVEHFPSFILHRNLLKAQFKNNLAIVEENWEGWQSSLSTECEVSTFHP